MTLTKTRKSLTCMYAIKGVACLSADECSRGRGWYRQLQCAAVLARASPRSSVVLLSTLIANDTAQVRQAAAASAAAGAEYEMAVACLNEVRGCCWARASVLLRHRMTPCVMRRSDCCGCHGLQAMCWQTTGVVRRHRFLTPSTSCLHHWPPMYVGVCVRTLGRLRYMIACRHLLRRVPTSSPRQLRQLRLIQW